MQVQTGTKETFPRTAVPGGVRVGAAVPRALAQDAFDVLEQFGAHQSVRRGEGLYAAGDDAGFCYRVVSGSIRAVGLDEDGRRQIAEFLLPGDPLGFDSLGTHHLSAEAVTDAVVVRYPRRAVDALSERHGALARRLHALALRGLRRAHERMFLLGRKTAGERVAAFLLEMAARAPGRGAGAVELPMTRADIADHLGLTTETVSRNMTQLCREGTIATTKSGVEIRDGRALAAFGTEVRH